MMGRLFCDCILILKCMRHDVIFCDWQFCLHLPFCNILSRKLARILPMDVKFCNVQVCRTCLVRTNRFYDLGDGEESLKFKLVYCVPEIDFTIVNIPVMCEQCARLLEITFSFIKVCTLTEEKLKNIKEVKGEQHGITPFNPVRKHKSKLESKSANSQKKLRIQSSDLDSRGDISSVEVRSETKRNMSSCESEVKQVGRKSRVNTSEGNRKNLIDNSVAAIEREHVKRAKQEYRVKLAENFNKPQITASNSVGSLENVELNTTVVTNELKQTAYVKPMVNSVETCTEIIELSNVDASDRATELIGNLNREMEYVLSACEKPFIIAPDDMSIVNGSILTVYNESESQNNSYPILVGIESVANINIPVGHEVLNAKEDVSAQCLTIEANRRKRTASVIKEKGSEKIPLSVANPQNTLLKEQKLMCKICRKIFSREENLRFHEKMHNNSSLFQCNTCNETFFNEDSLINHIRLHKVKQPSVSSDKLEECELCGTRLHRSCITEHEKIHQRQTRFTCRICEKQFSKKGLLIYHIRTHTIEEKSSIQEKSGCECDICKKTTRPARVNINIQPVLTDAKLVDKSKSKIIEMPPILEKQPSTVGTGSKSTVSENSSKKRKLSGSVKQKRQINKSKDDLLRDMPVLEPQVAAIDPSLIKTAVNIDKVVRNSDKNVGKILIKEQTVTRSTPEQSSATEIISNEDQSIIISSDDEATDVRQPSTILSVSNVSSCEICLKSFVSHLLLTEHCKQHLELQCTDCGTYFSNIYDILQHEELKHKVQCFQCALCSVRIVLKSNFIEHITSHDIAKPLTTCKVCYIFLSRNYAKFLPRFKLFIGKKTFQCDVCCKILQFTGIDELLCNICDLRFHSRLSLDKHRQSYRLTNVKCDMCCAYFHSVADFHDHVKEATKFSTPKCILSHQRFIFGDVIAFKCIKCFQMFRTEEALKHHCLKLQHYKCDDCSKIFSDWTDLNAHLNSHPLLLCAGCRSFILGDQYLKEHKSVCPLTSASQNQHVDVSFDITKNLLCIKCNGIFCKKGNLIEHLIFTH